MKKMSQEDVLKIIEELGGETTLVEIRKRVREKYPDRTLYLYVSDRLKKLERNGLIERTDKEGSIIWKIKKKKRRT